MIQMSIDEITGAASPSGLNTTVEDAMTAKKAIKIKAANVAATLYDGCYDVGFDCVGTTKCAHARFYTDPPDPDDDCAFLHHGSCTHAPARKAALEQLSERIAEELMKYEG